MHIERRRSSEKGKKAKPAVDPVCGKELSRRGTICHITSGERFFFCSDACLQRFLTDPARFTVSPIETK